MLLQRQTRQRSSRPSQIRTRPALEPLEERRLLASTIFVATTGNNTSGQGTLNAPFATLRKAVDVANPGDVIILRGGTYNGGITISDPNITIKSYDGEWARITASNTDSTVSATLRFDLDAWNCTVQRVEIIGGYNYSLMTLSNWDSGARIEYGASNLTIEDCKLHDSGRDVIKITPGSNDVIIRRCEIYNSGRRDATNAEGIDNVNGDRMILQDSYIHHITTSGIYPKGGASGCIIERNLFDNIGQVGIMVGGDTDVDWFDNANTQYYESIDTIVRNNIVTNIQMAGIGLYASLRPQVYNNTLVNVGMSDQAAVLFTAVNHYVPPNYTSYVRTPNTDVTFVNNIVTQSSASTRPMFSIRNGGLTGSFTLNNNRYFDAGGASQFWDERAGRTYFGGLSGWRAAAGGDISSTEGNPLLDSNRHLTAASPAINAGRSLTSPGLDYDGGTKSGALDIGADEYGAGTPLLVLPRAGTIGTGAPTAANVTVNAPSPDMTFGLEPDAWDPSQKALVVRGTANADIIYLQATNDQTQVMVFFNGNLQGRFWASQFSHIVVDGKAGDDRIEVSTAVTKNAQLIGGSGNDVLLGGGGHDLLQGGDGADWLEGRNGTDVLIGGRQADCLWGGTYRLTSNLDRDDLLIAGTTLHDNNTLAFGLICKEWTSNGTYASRVVALNTGDKGLPVLNSDTVNNDDAEDQLYGQAGLDWFFCTIQQDRVLDQMGGERLN